MITLQTGYNEFIWTGPRQRLQDLAWLTLIERARGHNLTTSSGFVGYDRGDLYASLDAFVSGASYLVLVTGPVALADAVASEGSFPAFDDYVPASGNQTLPTPAPTTPAASSAMPLVFPFTGKASVQVPHNLGRRVLVQVLDSDERLIEGSITIADANNIIVNFSQVLSGTILIN